MSATASPRSGSPPPLARSSPMKSARCVDGAMYWARLNDNIVPVMLGLAVLVAALLVWIAKDHSVLVRELGWPEFSHPGCLAGLVLLAGLAATAYGTACAYRQSGHTGQMVLVGTFVAVAVLLAVAFWLFYRSHDYQSAFWVMVAVAIVAVVHLYFVYQSAHNVALLCCLPLAAVVVFLLWAYWRSYHPAHVTVTL